MVNVSKTTLDSRKLTQLFGQLNKTVGRLNQRQVEIFFSNFLGKEEKIMLAKRLAAIIMLKHGHSLYRVADVLKISPTTAQNYKLSISKGAYNSLFDTIQKKKSGYIALLDAIDATLHLGGILPHYGQTHASEAYKRARKN